MLLAIALIFVTNFLPYKLISMQKRAIYYLWGQASSVSTLASNSASGVIQNQSQGHIVGDTVANALDFLGRAELMSGGVARMEE